MVLRNTIANNIPGNHRMPSGLLRYPNFSNTNSREKTSTLARKQQSRSRLLESFLLALSDIRADAPTASFSANLSPWLTSEDYLRANLSTSTICRSISSRAASEAERIPWMRSLNSSGLDARDSASSSVISSLLYRSNSDWSDVCMPYCEVPAAMASWINRVLSGLMTQSLMYAVAI